MKRALKRAQAHECREKIAAACFARATAAGDLSVCLYGPTSLYFEAEHKDDLRRVGYLKERRVVPQVAVGLLGRPEQIPLKIGCVAGNKAETTTLIPVVKAFQYRHGVAYMVIVADAG